MSESNEPESESTLAAGVTIHPGCTGTMKIVMSNIEGGSAWMPLTAEQWEDFKAAGDRAMAETIRLSPPA